MEFPPIYLPLTEQARYKILHHGRGAGGSWTIARLLLLRCTNRRERWLCAREYQKSIKDSVHSLLSKQIEILQLPGWSVTDREIRCGNSSQFIFEGLHANASSIKSKEGLNGVWVEEAEHVSEDSWNIIEPTIREPNSEIWVNFNPQNEADPTCQRFIVNPPPDSIVIKSTWRDNPWFPEVLAGLRDHMWATDPDLARHVWDGEYRKHSNAEIFAHKWIVEPFTPDEDWDGPYHGADWGFANDPTALVRFWVYSGMLWIEREAYGVGVELDELPDFFRAAVPACDKYLIYGDSSRPETISYLANPKRGFRVASAKKWTGCVEDGIEWLKTFDRIVIHPRCVNMQDEAKAYSYKLDRLTGQPLPIIVDASNHLWDALRYGAEPLMKRRTTSMALIE